MDDPLRNGLWNVLSLTFWRHLGDAYAPVDVARILTITWVNFYKEPLDTMGELGRALYRVRQDFFKWPWNVVYDYIQLLAESEIDWSVRYEMIQSANAVLERELAAYRFVETELIPVGTAEELAAIEGARHDASPYSLVQEHLRQAASLMADRRQPDFRNSIKESITAVEATGQILTGKRQPLGDVLKVIEPPLHPALRGAFEKLYGWTSDAEGIRHALMDQPTVGVDDARFMLVVCGGFVSYLLANAASGRR